jgi:hypothetical protein
MRYLIATLLGLAAAVGVIAEFQHIGVSIDALTGLTAVAVDGCVTILTVYIWGEIAAAHADVDRILSNDRRRAADQQIVDVANAAQVQL